MNCNNSFSLAQRKREERDKEVESERESERVRERGRQIERETERIKQFSLHWLNSPNFDKAL